MKKTGRQIVFFIIMLMVTSMTILSAQAAKPRDLQTELKNFFPGVDNYNQNVWQLYPKKISTMTAYSEGRPSFTAEVGSRTNQFFVETSVEFDSDFYRQYSPAAPVVKGTFCYIKNDNDSSRTYIAIINDNRILEYLYTHQKQKDRFGDPCGTISQSDYEKVDEMKGESYEFGIPIFKYKDAKGAEVSMEFSPEAIVKIYEIAHPIGNFLEGHTGKLTTVSVSAFDRNVPSVLKITKEFTDDRLYLFSIAFIFNSNESTKEIYRVFQRKSGDLIMVARSFFSDWQP